MAWRPHIERTVAKALCRYVRTYFPSKSGRLSTNIKSTLLKALIRSFMAYACPTRECMAGAHLLKLQYLHNSVLRAVGKLDRCTQVRNCTWPSEFLTCMTM
jgi:hypothetical protein